MRATIAVGFLALLVIGCAERKPEATSASDGAGFSRWTTETSPLDMYSIDANDASNWYFPARMESFDLTQPVWSYDTGGIGPVRAVSGGGAVFLASEKGRVAALRADDGSLLWEKEYRGEQLTSLHLTPYFLAVGKGSPNSGLQGSQDRVRLLDPRDGSELQTLTTTWDVLGFFHDATRFYVLSSPSNMRALDLRTGKTVARADFTRATSEAVRAGDRVFILGQDRALASISSDELRLRKFFLGEKLLSHLVAGEGLLLFFEGDTVQPGLRPLLALDAPELSVRWRHNFPDYVNALPVLVGDRVVGTTNYGTAYALSSHDGSILWERDLESPSRLIAVFQDRAFIISFYYSKSVREKLQVPLRRFFKRVPRWAPEGAVGGFAFSLLDIGTGELVQQEVVTDYMDILAVAPGVLVFGGGRGVGLTAFPAKFTSMEVPEQ